MSAFEPTRSEGALGTVTVSRLSPFPKRLVAESLPIVLLLKADRAHSSVGELRAAARKLCAASQARFASRSYRFPLALVATHQFRVGVDIERVDGLTTLDAPAILTPGELARGVALTDEQVSSIWSAKEALAKALGDALDYEPRRLEGPWFWGEGRCGRYIAAPFSVNSEHCAWVVWEQPDREEQ